MSTVRHRDVCVCVCVFVGGGGGGWGGKIQEKYHPLTSSPHWKLPGGHAGLGKDASIFISTVRHRRVCICLCVCVCVWGGGVIQEKYHMLTASPRWKLP